MLQELAQSGVKRVAVLTPGFVSDCLETLEEIGVELRHAFLAAGGEKFARLDCLNDSEDGLRALETVARRELAGLGVTRDLLARSRQPPPQRVEGPKDEAHLMLALRDGDSAKHHIGAQNFRRLAVDLAPSRTDEKYRSAPHSRRHAEHRRR